jgi:hypothetical protein
MTRPALEVDHNNALGLAPSWTTADGAGTRAGFQVEQLPQRKPEHGGTAEAEEIASRHFGFSVTKIAASPAR